MPVGYIQLQAVQGGGEHVQVGVDEARQQHAALKVHGLGSGGQGIGNVLPAACGQDAVILREDVIRPGAGIVHGEDGSVKI